MSGPPTPAQPRADSDAVRLSAYLDNELSVQEREDLERRLGLEPALGDELAALAASRDLLKAAICKAAEEGLQAPSQAFQAFGQRLSEVLPLELPVASARKPPRLRRALVVAAGLLAAFFLFLFLAKVLARLEGSPHCGWYSERSAGQASILRSGRLVVLRDAGALRLGDKLYLEAQSEVQLSGPYAARISAKGPLTLLFQPAGEVFLEHGKIRVEAPADLPEDAFVLRTPDGLVRLQPGESRFEVEVR